MKYQFKLASSALVLGALVLSACTKTKLDTDKQRASYGIGQQIGQNMKTQGISVDTQAVAAGMQDAIDGKESRVKSEDLQKAMTALQQETMKKAQETAEKTKKEGDDFLAKNKTQEGWKTTASGLQYKVEKEGEGASPKETDTVKVHYTGTLTNGTKFDSSVDRGQPAEFPVNGVIKGWTEALQLMKPGGKMKLAIPPDLAYGPSGRPGIPANSVLLFDVELLAVQPAKAAGPAGPAAKSPHGAKAAAAQAE
jgi:FKBP-type peptidyl-prolyl cis-trans isomerase FkpA/FKBP-type peptidyl-prolyl cis-trans isomerase FklB